MHFDGLPDRGNKVCALHRPPTRSQAPATTGSTVVCGIAAWPPLPTIVTTIACAPAIIAPALLPIVPALQASVRLALVEPEHRSSPNFNRSTLACLMVFEA
jgi:hypothetical protein